MIASEGTAHRTLIQNETVLFRKSKNSTSPNDISLNTDLNMNLFALLNVIAPIGVDSIRFKGKINF